MCHAFTCFTRSVLRHLKEWPCVQAVMLEFFQQLLSLAQQLLRHAAEPVQAAGAQLYCLLFKHFTAAYNQQEVGRGWEGVDCWAVSWLMAVAGVTHTHTHSLPTSAVCYAQTAGAARAAQPPRRTGCG